MKTESQTNAAIAEEKLYDLVTIAKFCHGDEEEVKEMVIIFIGELVSLVEEIRSAYSNSDFAGIKKLTHKIKPVISYYNAVKIESELKMIDVLADQEAHAEMFESQLLTLQAAINQVVEDMNKNILSDKTKNL